MDGGALTLLDRIEQTDAERRYVAVLDWLREHGEGTKCEIAQALGLRHPAVDRVITDAEWRDLVERTGELRGLGAVWRLAC